MSSKSSSNDRPRRFAIGRVSGHRGGSGELTVRTGVTEAARWLSTARVWIVDGTGGTEGRGWIVERSRAYRDRLVLKLQGVDDASQAAAFRGSEVQVEEADLPAREPGEFLTAALEGCTVEDEAGMALGQVVDVIVTGGTDVLVVSGASDEEILIPLAKEIVVKIDESRRRLVVKPPDGLLELNRRPGGKEQS